MPHVTFVPLTGFRIREDRLLELGMSLPGLAPRAKAVGQLPALGLLTLAGLMPQDWTCNYVPANAADDALVERIADERPTMVAISALAASVEEAYELSHKLRERGIFTVIGGLHATALPEEAAQHASSVVVGRGEIVWQQLLADVTRGCPQPIYRAPRTSVTWKTPIPRFELIGQQPPRFTLQTQTGCPLACDFCAASRLLGSFREKPIPAIEQELASIRKIDARPLVELADDNTFAGTRDPAELFTALRNAEVRYFTESDWRIGERPEVLNGLAASGCAQVLVGIESLVFRYPGMGQKQAELNCIMESIEHIQNAGVPVNGCFILGAEGETRQSIDQLIEFILESPLAEVQLTLQTPFPGTALHNRLCAANRLLPGRGWPYYTLFDLTYQPDILSIKELESGFEQAVSAIFSRSATQRRSTIRRCILKRRSKVL